MLSVLGYMLISIILIILLAVAGRIYINLTKSEPEYLFMGPLIKEFSDLIIENSKKFIPVENETMLLYIIACIGAVLISIIKAFLIK